MKIQNVQLVLPTTKKDMNGEERIAWRIGKLKQVNKVLKFWDIHSLYFHHAKGIDLIFKASFFF